MEGNKTENNIELTEEEKEMRKKFIDKNPEMTLSDLVEIRQNIFEKGGDKNPSTRHFLEVNGIIIPLKKETSLPLENGNSGIDKDALDEMAPSN